VTREKEKEKGNEIAGVAMCVEETSGKIVITGLEPGVEKKGRNRKSKFRGIARKKRRDAVLMVALLPYGTAASTGRDTAFSVH